MTWVDWFIRFASDKYIKDECQLRKLCTQKIEPAKVYGIITSDQLHDLLPKEFINPWNNSPYQIRRTWWDSEFYLTSDDEVKRFLEWDETNKNKYEADHYDCNSFAVSWWARFREWCRGGCGGMVTEVKPGHALDFYVNPLMKIRIVEPQNDVVKDISEFPYIDHFLI